MAITVQFHLQSLFGLLLLHLHRPPLLFFLALLVDASRALILVVVGPGVPLGDSHGAKSLEVEFQTAFDAVRLRREMRAACRAVLACWVGRTHFLSFPPFRSGDCWGCLDRVFLIF